MRLTKKETITFTTEDQVERSFSFTVTDGASIKALPPVRTFEDIAVTYPEAQEGDLCYVIEDGDLYVRDLNVVDNKPVLSWSLVGHMQGLNVYETWLAQGNEGTYEDYIKSITGQSFVFKGDVETEDELPTENIEKGDAYLLTDNNILVVWNGTSWDQTSLASLQGKSLEYKGSVETKDDLPTIYNKQGDIYLIPSTYELAIYGDYEWQYVSIEFLKGIDGETGEPGKDGVDGKDGTNGVYEYPFPTDLYTGKIEFHSLRKENLLGGWAALDGSTFPVESALGQAILALPNDIKTDWGITTDGTNAILPTLAIPTNYPKATPAIYLGDAVRFIPTYDLGHWFGMKFTLATSAGYDQFPLHQIVGKGVSSFYDMTNEIFLHMNGVKYDIREHLDITTTNNAIYLNLRTLMGLTTGTTPTLTMFLNVKNISNITTPGYNPIWYKSSFFQLGLSGTSVVDIIDMPTIFLDNFYPPLLCDAGSATVSMSVRGQKAILSRFEIQSNVSTYNGLNIDTTNCDQILFSGGNTYTSFTGNEYNFSNAQYIQLGDGTLLTTLDMSGTDLSSCHTFSGLNAPQLPNADTSFLMSATNLKVLQSSFNSLKAATSIDFTGVSSATLEIITSVGVDNTNVLTYDLTAINVSKLIKCTDFIIGDKVTAVNIANWYPKAMIDNFDFSKYTFNGKTADSTYNGSVAFTMTAFLSCRKLLEVDLSGDIGNDTLKRNILLSYFINESRKHNLILGSPKIIIKVANADVVPSNTLNYVTFTY